MGKLGAVQALGRRSPPGDSKNNQEISKLASAFLIQLEFAGFNDRETIHDCQAGEHA
jgi:hypothetical protein